MTRRNDPCPCGSGKRYKQCCGRVEASARTQARPANTHTEFQRLDALPPRGPDEPEPRRLPDTPGELLVVENFLTGAECRRLIEIGEAQPSEDAQIVVMDDDGAESETAVRHSRHRIAGYRRGE